MTNSHHTAGGVAASYSSYTGNAANTALSTLQNLCMIPVDQWAAGLPHAIGKFYGDAFRVSITDNPILATTISQPVLLQLEAPSFRASWEMLHFSHSDCEQSKRNCY